MVPGEATTADLIGRQEERTMGNLIVTEFVTSTA
jgi:hypothetical protein